MKMLIWLSGDGNPVVATTRITIAGSVLVIAAAAILGFTALRDLFIALGLFSPWLGFLFPLLFDFSEITAAAAVMNAKFQGEDNPFAWRMVKVFTGLGIVANIAHALHAYSTGKIDVGQATLAVIFTSLFPLSVALVTHILKQTITRQVERNRQIATNATLAEQIAAARQDLADFQQQRQAAEAALNRERESLTAEMEQLTGKIVDLKQEIAHLQKQKRQSQRQAPAEVGAETETAARQILAEWVAEGLSDRQINGSELGRRLGKSERLGRDLKKRLLPEIRAAFAKAAGTGPAPSNGAVINGTAWTGTADRRAA